MRFSACLKKDIRLLTGGGIRSLLFLFVPVLLIVIMLYGMKDAAAADRNTVSFNIAIRDNDKTVMSGMLISQLDNVEIFDTIYRVGDETDEEMTAKGCAAVVTIPQYFFYMLYDFQDTDVVIALNEDMPVEAELVRSAISSLVNILEENQRVHYAAAKVRYGELSEDEWQEVYEEYSDAALSDTLSRLQLYELENAYRENYDGSKLFFTASVLSMLVMFVPLTMLRSVSEELDSGLASRFALTGGSIFEAVLSKFVISAVMTAIPSALLLIILRTGSPALIPALSVSFLFSFTFFLFISLLLGNTSAAQFAGNVIMLLVLTVGGALYPASLLPKAIQPVSRFMLPGILLDSLKYASMQRTPGESFGLLIPLILFAACFAVLSVPFLKARRRA